MLPWFIVYMRSFKISTVVFFFFSIQYGEGKGELQHKKIQNGWATQTTGPKEPKIST